MKKIEEILNQQPVYLHDWTDKVDLVGDFEQIYMNKQEYESETPPYKNEKYWLENKARMNVALDKYKNVNILFASYNYENYSGEAWVLFEQNGKLYEVNGSHCSCYGLEGQWEPEETTLEVLEYRLTKGTFGNDSWSENNFREELLKFLGI